MLVILWILCGVAAAFVASAKGRSGFGWFLLGLLFGPIALLAAAVTSPDRASRERRETLALLQSGKGRPCPACAEVIRAEASRCRYCNSDVDPLPPRRGLFG